MTIDKNNLKHFNMRMDKELWLFIKNASAAQDISMGDLIINLVEKYKSKIEKKLTTKDINV